MLRPGSLTRNPAAAAGPASSRTVVVPARVVLPCTGEHLSRGLHQFQQCRDAGTSLLCRARRQEPDADIADMNMEERLERLDQLSGRVGEIRSVFDRESLLRQMGALDPALYNVPDGADEEEGEADDRPLEWIDWNDDPRSHVVSTAVTEPLPDGLRSRMVAGADLEEDAAVIQVPLHNCLALYVCEGLEVEESLEREEAAADFSRMQLAFLERWCAFHGPLPPALVELLCDFSLHAANARAKMALWVLWVAEGCGSEYWRQELGAMPPPEAMPHLEFCTDEELEQLQWLPYALPAAVRREALRSFYTGFGASELAAGLGFQPTVDSDGEAALVAEAEAGSAAEPLRPLPPFERFLWAYCIAESRTLGNGERVVFFPQANPCLYTTDPAAVNTTLAVVADDGPVLDEFAVLAALRPLQAGEQLGTHPPFGQGATDGGGGATSQLHTQFGLVPELGGNEADILDLEPETGSILDDWLKRLLDQEASTRLDMVTDPRLRHLLALAETGDADLDQLPPLRKILPPLQMPKLWGPGLVAGVTRLQLLEQQVGPVDEEDVAMVRELAAEEDREAADIAAARGGGAGGGGGAPAVSYKEYDEWRSDPSTWEIVEVPGEPELLDTPEGRAEWRRMKAAWSSLPRVSPDNREHGHRMELAMQGVTLDQVFSSPRDITRELAAADSLLQAINTILGKFPTTIEQDEQLLAGAAASAAAAPPAGRKGSRGTGRRGSRRTGSASGSESDSESGTDAAAVTTARMRGVVAWRLEMKLVLRQMAGMVEEYREALAEVEASVAAEAVAA